MAEKKNASGKKTTVSKSSKTAKKSTQVKKSETKKRNLPLHKFKSAILVLDLNGKN